MNSVGEGPPHQDARMNPPVRPLMQNCPNQQWQPLLCWDCNLPGHIRRNCPMRNRPMYGPRSGNGAANRGLTRNMEDKANVYLRISLFGKEIACLVDTGCELTLVPKDLVDQLPNVSLSPSICEVWAANNTPIRIDGETRLPFFLNDRCVWTTVSEDVEEVMLGIDWLEGMVVFGILRREI